MLHILWETAKIFLEVVGGGAIFVALVFVILLRQVGESDRF